MVISVQQAVASIPPGVDPDVWYDKVYVDQCRPCSFRRYYGLLIQGKPCPEITEQQADEIRMMIEDGMSDHEAFLVFVPDYVSRSDYATEWLRVRRAASTQQIQPVVVEPSVVETVIVEPLVEESEESDGWQAEDPNGSDDLSV